MRLHFLHVGKTGGTAIRQALRSVGLPDTPYGPIQLHRHWFRMEALPSDDYVFFCIRDPIDRFLSGFYSRLNKGQPRYYREWGPGERTAFAAFPTPQRLAAALASDDEEERLLAQWSMGRIRHLRFMQWFIGSPAELQARLNQVVYIGRQETLSIDWGQMKALLGVPDVELPSSPILAHRQDASLDRALDDTASQALREWYARDYELVEYCDSLRAQRGWGSGSVDREAKAHDGGSPVASLSPSSRAFAATHSAQDDLRA